VSVKPHPQIARPIRENPIARKGTAAGIEKSGSYYIPEQICATCFQSTRNCMHAACRRDRSGRLLVAGGPKT
jgi:hypothetical protein